MNPHAKMHPLGGHLPVPPPVVVEDLRTECAWCGVLIRDGAAPTSHGICPACATRWRKSAGLPSGDAA